MVMKGKINMPLDFELFDEKDADIFLWNEYGELK
jgi:hypothetical protein